MPHCVVLLVTKVTKQQGEQGLPILIICDGGHLALTHSEAEMMAHGMVLMPGVMKQ